MSVECLSNKKTFLDCLFGPLLLDHARAATALHRSRRCLLRIQTIVTLPRAVHRLSLLLLHVTSSISPFGYSAIEPMWEAFNHPIFSCNTLLFSMLCLRHDHSTTIHDFLFYSFAAVLAPCLRNLDSVVTHRLY